MNSNNSEAAAVRSLAAALALGPPPLGNLAVPVYAQEGLGWTTDEDIGPGFEEPVCILALAIDIEAMGIVFDHPDSEPLRG